MAKAHIRIPIAFVREQIADLSGSAVKLYVLLLNCRNGKTGLCCPGEAWLSKKMGCEERTVRRAIRELEDAGIISVRRGKHNTYTIHETATVNRTKMSEVPDAIAVKFGRSHRTRMSA